jgi:hypothetical protein
MCRRYKLGQYAAGVSTALLSATRTQLQKLLFQCPHAFEACTHLGQLLIHQQINVVTPYAGLVDKAQ